MKTVSVIIPCYEQAKYLPETLQSVLDQTYPYWECIVVNDGSPDNTVEIANQFIQKDNRFRLIDKQNEGVSSARNAGLEVAQGDFIQFLDSDDLIHPRKFELQLREVSEGTGIILSSYMNFENEISDAYVNSWNSHKIQNLREDILYYWGDNFTIPIHSALFSSLYFAKYKIRFPESFTGEEDWIFWIMCTSVNSTYKYEDDVLAYYRQHKESACSQTEMMVKSRMNAFVFISKKLLNEHEQERFENRMKHYYTERVVDLDFKVKHFKKGKKKYKTLFSISLLVILVLLISFLFFVLK